jgi:Biotin-requiring enzyme
VDTQLKTGTAVVLPSLGESIDEATITRWLKAPGDRVEVDEPLLEVATDKVDSEIPSPVAGTLVELVVGRGRRGDRHHRCGGGVCQTRTVRLHTAAGADKYARVGAARRRSSLL